MSPFILSYAQSPRSPWQFLDTYVTLDETSPVDASKTQKGSGVQFVSYLGLWVSTLSITCVRLVIHFIVWLMIFVFVMPNWQNHTLTSLVILFCSERSTWTWVCLAKKLVLLLLDRLPSDLFWVPTWCVSTIRSAFNSWIRSWKWKISLTIVTVRVQCVTVSSVGKISMSWMTLGLVVNSLPHFNSKLMSSFWPNMFDSVRSASRTPSFHHLLKTYVSHVCICPVLQVMVVTRYSRTQIVGLLRQPTLLSLQLRRRPMLCLSLPLREKRLLLFLHLQGGSFVDPHSTEIQDVNT